AFLPGGSIAHAGVAFHTRWTCPRGALPHRLEREAGARLASGSATRGMAGLRLRLSRWRRSGPAHPRALGPAHRALATGSLALARVDGPGPLAIARAPAPDQGPVKKRAR